MSQVQPKSADRRFREAVRLSQRTLDRHQENQLAMLRAQEATARHEEDERQRQLCQRREEEQQRQQRIRELRESIALKNKEKLRELDTAQGQRKIRHSQSLDFDVEPLFPYRPPKKNVLRRRNSQLYYGIPDGHAQPVEFTSSFYKEWRAGMIYFDEFYDVLMKQTQNEDLIQHLYDVEQENDLIEKGYAEQIAKIMKRNPNKPQRTPRKKAEGHK